MTAREPKLFLHRWAEEEEEVFIEAKDNKRTIWTVLAIPTPNISHNVNNRIVEVYTYVYNIFTMLLRS